METEGSLPQPLSWASSIQSIPPHPTSWRSILPQNRAPANTVPYDAPNTVFRPSTQQTTDPCKSTVQSNLSNKHTSLFPRRAVSWSGLYQEVCIAAVTDQSIPRAEPGRVVTRDPPQVENEAYFGIKYNVKLLPPSLVSYSGQVSDLVPNSLSFWYYVPVLRTASAWSAAVPYLLISTKQLYAIK
jgi:hypothetical protein